MMPNKLGGRSLRHRRRRRTVIATAMVRPIHPLPKSVSGFGHIDDLAGHRVYNQNLLVALEIGAGLG